MFEARGLNWDLLHKKSTGEMYWLNYKGKVRKIEISRRVYEDDPDEDDFEYWCVKGDIVLHEGKLVTVDVVTGKNILLDNGVEIYTGDFDILERAPQLVQRL